MKIAFISSSDVNNRLARSGVPYSIFHQLKKYYDVVWIKPNPKDTFFHTFLYAISRLTISVMDKLHWGYWHVPLENYVGCKSVERQLKGKGFDAIFSMGCGGTAYLNTKLPIFFRADAIAPSALDYYVFNVPKFARHWTYNVEKNLLDRTTVFFTASEWINEEVEKYKIADPSKCVFVPTGANLDIDYVKYRVHEYGKNIPLNMLFVGYDLERKGFDIAYDAMQILNSEYGMQATLTVIGGSPNREKYDNPALRVIGKLNKNKKEEYDRFYEEFYQSDIFVFPTRAEFHGIVNCEAAAYGLPIFSCKTGGVPSYCIDGINGRCLPLEATPKDFATAIHNAVVGGEMENYSENSRKLFLERFNWDVWAESVSKVINDIMM